MSSWWGPVMVVVTGLTFGAALIALGTMVSSRWDRAVALKVCDGLPILQLEDGTTWLRVSGLRMYRVENWRELC